MAARLSRSSRTALIVLAAGSSALLAVPALASASPSAGAHAVTRFGGTHTVAYDALSARGAAKRAHHKQTIPEVQHELGELAARNAQVVETFDRARALVQARSKQAGQARVVALRAARTYQAASTELSQVLQAQYESGNTSLSSGALLTSNSGSSYLDRMSTMDLVSSHEAQVVTDVQVTRHSAALASRHATALLHEATLEQAAAAAKRDAVTVQIAKYRKLLDTLNSAQQADYLRATDPTLSGSQVARLNVPAPSPEAAKAVQFALSQVGKPYVFGAAGPSSYDCSGLTMASWAHAGVSLPHSAAEQYNYGTHIARSQLEPGDLIFFYQPIGHVTIYIGDGYMVSAPETGQDVSVVPLSAFNNVYAGATRLH